MNCLIAAGRRQNDERVQAEHTLDCGAGAGLEEAHIAAGAFVNDAQIGEIVPERASGERHQDRLVQQERCYHHGSEHAGKTVVSYHAHQHQRAEKDDHQDHPVEHDPTKSARKPRVFRHNRYGHIGMNAHYGHRISITEISYALSRTTG